MTQLTAFVTANWPLLVIGYWLFNVLVSNMPEPMPNGSPLYKYFFGVLHSIAGNADKFGPILKGLFKMKTLAIVALCLGLAIGAHAQAVQASATPSPTPSTTIQNFWAAGVSYNSSGSPAAGGTGLYAHNLAGSNTYAFTAVDVLPTSTKPLTVTTNIGVGVAQKVLTIKNIPVYIPTSVGISWTGSNTGWQWNTGGMAVIKIKGNLSIDPAIRILKNNTGNGFQPIIGVLFGWGK